uniref:Zinc knuckle CX2CX4HX4C domain-containing protein n=1 Tax=Cannabis sativa TaxID=3483 RepID=A0A803QSV9_CANSA
VPVAREEELAIDTRWCLVEKLLTGRVSDFNVFQNMMAFLWQPGMGIHNLQSGNQTLSVVTVLGNYIEQFLESDPNNFVGVWREYLHVRVWIDVRKPIKRMKISTDQSSWYWVNFKYEKLPTFCFICGIIGHAERFCPRLFEKPLHLHDEPYGLELRASNQRGQSSFGAQWLHSGAVVREEGRQPSHASSDSLGSNLNPTVTEEIMGQIGQNHGTNNIHFHGIIDSRNSSDGILGINGEDAALNVSNNGNFFDSDITTIVDSKRKRPGNTFVEGMGLQGRTLNDIMEVIEIDNTGLSKNGPLAGSSFQAAQSNESFELELSWAWEPTGQTILSGPCVP